MDTLFLHPDTHGQFSAWGREAGSIRVLEPDTLPALAARYAGARVVLFLPSTQCVLTRVALSSGQRKQMAGNFAWLIEEQVGEDVESLHVIAGPEQADGQTPVLAIATDVLESWRTQCREAGWALHAVLPDVMLLPQKDNAWMLDVRAGQCCLRTGWLSGATLERVTPEQLLEAAWQEQIDSVSHPDRLLVSGDSQTNHAGLSAWAESHQMAIEFVGQQDVADVLLSVPDWARHPGNFLQGRYATQRQVFLPTALRVAAMFLLVAFAVQLVSDWGRYAYYHRQATKVQTEATALYKQLFPGERRTDHLRRRMQAHLDQGGASGGALPIMTQLGDAMQGSGLDTQRIDFTGGTFTLDVDARSITDIDALKQRLSGMGLQAEIVSANAQNGLIRGRLRVETGT
jgi:general secretion pathway protein L